MQVSRHNLSWFTKLLGHTEQIASRNRFIYKTVHPMANGPAWDTRMGLLSTTRSLPVAAVVIAAIAIIGVACGSSTPASEPTPTSSPTTPTPTSNPGTGEFQDHLNTARNKWDSRGLESYELVQSWNFFGFNNRPVKITVVEGRMIGAVDLTTGNSILDDERRLKMTVPEMFDWIQAALDDSENKRVLSADYDRILGFPVTASTNKQVGASDSSLFVAVSEFKELTDDGQQQIGVDFSAAKIRWAANSPDSYTFDITWSCFCGFAGNITRIEVRDGRVFSAIDPSTGAIRPPSESGPKLTFDELLGRIETALNGADSFVHEATFDRDLGFPISSSIDWLVGAIDDESSFTVTNFRPGSQTVDLDQLRSELDAATFRWFDSGPQSYEFVFRWQCFCPPEANTSIRVRVEGGQIVSTVNSLTGEAVVAPGGLEYQTVVDLFGWISLRLARNPEFAALEFDTETGYPISANFNPIIQLIDEEEAFFIEELTPLNIHGELQSTLDDARERWDALTLTSYTYRFNWQCFCLDDFTAQVTVTVQDEEVTSVVRVKDGQPVNEQFRDDFVTVDALFDRLQAAIDQGAASIRAEFDSESGLPTEVFIDFQAIMADEELGWNAGAVASLE